VDAVSRCSTGVFTLAVGGQGSSPLSSTHFHRRLSATEPVDDASAMRPLSDVGEPAVGLYLHGAHLVRSRRIRHFMPTTGVPAPQDPHKTADRRHPGGDHRRPHQYLSQPHAPLNSDDPLLARAEVGSACPCASGCPRSVGRIRATRGALPATVSLITHPPKRHNLPAAQHRSTRDREHYGETFLPGVVATDLDTEHVEPMRTSGTGRDSWDG